MELAKFISFFNKLISLALIMICQLMMDIFEIFSCIEFFFIGIKMTYNLIEVHFLVKGYKLTIKPLLNLEFLHYQHSKII